MPSANEIIDTILEAPIKLNNMVSLVYEIERFLGSIHADINTAKTALKARKYDVSEKLLNELSDKFNSFIK